MEQSIEDRVRHLEGLNKDRLNSNQSHSVQFAVVLVANLMLINSGALFAFPNFVQKFSSSIAEKDLVAHAAACFVAGIVCATMCGYAAHHNFQAHAQHESYLRGKQIFDTNFPNADYTNPIIKKYADDTTAGIIKYSRVIRWTFSGGNLIGICSLILFVVGCYYTGSLILKL